MSVTLRVLLFVASIITFIWIFGRIRKSKVKLEDAIFWFFIATVFAVLGIFPQIAYWMSWIVGIQSPANCVFMFIIALLIEKIFTLSIQLSQLEDKMEIMAAELAIRCKDIEDKKENISK